MTEHGRTFSTKRTCQWTMNNLPQENTAERNAQSPGRTHNSLPNGNMTENAEQSTYKRTQENKINTFL